MNLEGVKRFGFSVIFAEVLVIISFFALIHFLDAENIGIVAITAALYKGLEATTNLGFDKYLIYCKDNVEQQKIYNVVWTLQILRGLVILCFSIFISSLVPLVFPDAHEIPSMVQMLGVIFFILAFKNTWLVDYERNHNFSVIANVNAISSIAKACCIFIFVWFYHSPWVYIAGQLTFSIVITALSYYFVPNKPQLSLDKSIIIDVFKYSKYLILIALVSYITSQFETFYIGSTLSLAILGVYFTWYRILQLPRSLITKVSGRLIFPIASELQRNNNFVIEDYHSFTFLLSLVVLMPYYGFLFFHGEYLLSFFSSNDYQGSLWIGRVLIFVNWCYAMTMTLTPFMLVFYPQKSTKYRTFEAFLLVCIMILLGELYGLRGVLAAISIVISIALILRIRLLNSKFTYYKYKQYIFYLLKIITILIIPILVFEQIILDEQSAINSFALHISFYLFYIFVSANVIIKKYRETTLQFNQFKLALNQRKKIIEQD